METHISTVNKISKYFILRKCIFLSIFILLLQGCEPIEAITDTYGAVIDEFTEEENNDELEVGQVLVQPSFTSATAVTMTVTVLNKAGTLIRDDTEVKCIFTDTEFNTFFDFNELTTSGTVGCGTNTTESTTSFPISFVAVAGGVTSDPVILTLPPGATA